MKEPIVKLIARPSFVLMPGELQHPDMHTKLQDIGTDAERLIECAGRTCYDSYGKGRSSTDYHANILKVGHESVMEHASFSFFITNVSRGLTNELVRHRAGVAISQRSTRYVDESESDWCLHPSTELVWSANVRALRHFIEMRASQYADAEIRFLAVKLWHIMRYEVPAYFSDYVEAPSPDGIGTVLTTEKV